MKICSKCFNDPEIVSLIERGENFGKCDFCNGTNHKVYDTETDTSLSEMFDEFLKIYTPASKLPQTFPKEETFEIEKALKENWNIFNSKVSPTQIKALLSALAKVKNTQIHERLNENVGIKELYDEAYKKEHQLLTLGTWENFKESLLHKNRLYTHHLREGSLKSYLSYISKVYKKGSLFYRARISSSRKPLSGQDVGAPPLDKSSDGRLNSKGISCLYLSNNRHTCALEVRALTNNYLSIGTFKLKKDIQVVDLNRISEISPFTGQLNRLEYALNLPILYKIKDEISKPQRSSETIFDYLPTQYIADFIRSIEEKGKPLYSGIEYPSVVDRNNGINLAIFNPELFEYTEVTAYEIIQAHLDTEPPFPERLMDDLRSFTFRLKGFS